MLFLLNLLYTFIFSSIKQNGDIGDDDDDDDHYLHFDDTYINDNYMDDDNHLDFDDWYFRYH